LMSPMAEAFRALFASVEFAPAGTVLYSCVTAKPFPSEMEEMRDTAAAQYMCPVRFRESIENLYRDGVRVFVEAGPESHLTAFVRDILRNRPHVAVSCDDRRRGADHQLRHLLGQLFAQGIPVDLEPLYGGMPQPVTALAPYLPTAIPVIQSTGPVATQLRACLHASMPASHAHPLPQERIKACETTDDLAPPVIAKPLGRPGALAGHFDLMQEFLRQQERVMSVWLDRRRGR